MRIVPILRIRARAILRINILKFKQDRLGEYNFEKKSTIYHILLSSGELLKNIRIEGGSLELKFNGVGKNFAAVEDSDGKQLYLVNIKSLKQNW